MQKLNLQMNGLISLKELQAIEVNKHCFIFSHNCKGTTIYVIFENLFIVFSNIYFLVILINVLAIRD